MKDKEYSIEERADFIINECMNHKETNPIKMFCEIAKNNYVRIHGPEHHILDGAVILTSFYNAGGKIDLKASLGELMKRGLQMPGATCGMWGVCGAVTSIGAALSIIDKTGPISTDKSWGCHMKYTSYTLNKLADIGGPRCCKRDAFVALVNAINYIKKRYNIFMDIDNFQCDFSDFNQQCIEERCPFHKEEV